jgi:hypothetical protein
MAAGFANGAACTHSSLRHHRLFSSRFLAIELISWVLSFDPTDPLYCDCDVHLRLGKPHLADQ